MSNPTSHDGTRLTEQPPTRRVFHVLPSVVALLTAVAMVLLIVTRQTEHLTTVASFGGSVFLGDAAANVTVNVMRR
ncbi:hypothetical protein [Streptomyces sp. NPDC001480]|uniref:hypothetical protein n=1 Tax=Streptomyces sp. NPDC001480 TaxID=3364577 RepID=UPI00368F1BA4